jgi:LacI family transcriptional regulator
LRAFERSGLFVFSIAYPCKNCKYFFKIPPKVLQKYALFHHKHPQCRTPFRSASVFLSRLSCSFRLRKKQRNFFDFNRNVTKSNRDAQFWSSKSKQAAEINALWLKLFLFRLIFGTECAILDLRKRLRTLQEAIPRILSRKGGQPMPSLKDLAKECGVSVATVSKALNDQPDIAAATRERIRAAARRMGYLPNAAARALKTNRTYNLGVLFVDERQSGLTHEYFSAVLDSFKVEAEKRGYDITFINHNISGRSMTYLEHCHYRSVDGVVIACVNFYDPQVVELVNSDVPVVTIDHVFNNRMAVLSDNVAGLKALVKQAWACGHRRIAFIHGEKTSVTENRIAGFYQACEELGLEIPEEYVRDGVYHDVERCAEETRALLALPQRPTCIIFPDDFSALGGYNALAEAGLSIPDDISVMGYDGIYLSRVVNPSLVTYQQNTAALGQTAADKLIELIEHPRVTLPEQIRVSGRLLLGRSVRSL